jgi:hypothetical protein
MPAQIASQGAVSILEFWDSETYTIHLYQNNVVLGNGILLANFTEVVTAGYAAHSQASGSLGAITYNDGVAEANEPNITWTFTNPSTAQTIYGMYILDTSGNLLWAASFDVAYVLGTTGGSLVLLQQMAGEQGQ